ncbi:MAG: F0F1 ATP synthase subunit A [Deltaproteobacteria bacterium]
MHSLLLPSFGLHAHTALMIYVIIGLAIFSVLMSKRFCLVPGGLQCVLETVINGLDALVNETMGLKGRKYLSFVATFAFFIFISSFLGFMPGFIPPTADFNTTIGLSIIVFCMTHIVGFKEHGIKYLKHFVGPVWWLAPLMIPIELIGHIARPVSLSLRLFGNMMGHEQIVGVFLLMMPVAYPLLMLTTGLGMIVIYIQSFIFSLLTMLYLGGALEEAH